MASTLFRSLLLASPLLLTSCAAGNSGGDGSGNPVVPPTGPLAITPLFGLSSAVAGPGSVRLDWKRPVPGFEVGIFVSTDRGAVFAASPQVFAVEEHLILTGLPDGVPHFFGLGIRPTPRALGDALFTPSGPILIAVPGAPIYIDAASTAVGPDGLTPATAFPDLASGLLAAFAQGGGNVWIRAGSYEATDLLLFVGVHASGGFGPAFDLDTRDPSVTPTIWNVPVHRPAIQVLGGDALGADPAGVLDGIEIRGNGLGGIGVDVVSSSVELRAVAITGMEDRGIRLRNSLPDSCFNVLIASSEASANGADGLSGSGAFDYFVHDSFFDANVQEGLDLDGLVPATAERATLEISGSRFFGNGSEGLDATLKAPLFPTSGDFAVRIRGSSFERNGLDGCLIDLDFELVPGYTADILVRECFARANSGSGFHLDLDAPGTTYLHRVQASGNSLDGLRVSSESDPGLVVVSTSAFVGNLGAGLRAVGPPVETGNRSLAVTHCLLAGNALAGMASEDIQSSAASSIAYLQPAPFSGTVAVGTVVADDPVSAGFTLAPEEYARVTAIGGPTLTLSAPVGFGSSAVLELADDSVLRLPASVASTVVVLDEAPAPGAFAAPGLLAAFAPGVATVEEDYRLLPGSIAEGAGMAPPGGPGVDAGIFGAPGAGQPGFADALVTSLFYPRSTAPAVAQGVGALDPITITFSADIDPSSAAGVTVRALRGSTPLAIGYYTLGADLVVTPPGVGWGAGDFLLVLDRGLRSLDGTPTAAPIALPFSVL